MLTLKNYVNWGIAHSDNVGKAEGVPLVMENCVINKKMKQLEVYGNSVQNGTPTPENPIEVESVGEPCIRNWFNKNLFLCVEDYNVATSYSFYKAKYIEGLKPNTKYNVVIERLNETNPTSAKCTVLLSGGVFLPTANNFTTIGHASSKDETNNSPHTSDVNGRLTIGIATSTTQEQLDSLWKNTNVYLYEDGDETTVYKIPVTVRGNNLFNNSAKNHLSGAYGTQFTSTPTGVKWKKTAVSASYTYVIVKLGKFSDFAEKTLTLSFDIDLQNDEVINPSYVRFLESSEDGKTVKEITGTGYYENGHFRTTANIGTQSSNPCLAVRLWVARAVSEVEYEFKNIMVSESHTDVPYEPYIEPQTTNVYLSEPLDYADVLNFRDKKVKRSDGTYEDVECELPILTAKTSVIEIDTSILPSNLKGKYIKR